MEGSILDPHTARPELSHPARWRHARTLWVVGVALLAYTILIAWTGGIDFTLGGIRIRSRSWQRPALLAVLFLATVGVIDRRHAGRVVGHVVRHGWGVWASIVGSVSPRAIAFTATVATFVAGLAFGTFTAGGADSSGYLNQARLFSIGRALDDSRLSERPPGAEAGYKQAPLGYRPAAVPTKLAPTYPPGYPLLMSPAFLIDPRGAHLIVPMCGALAVWVIFALGSSLGMPRAGAAASFLLSVSPTFLYQLVQPMSDVPVTAAWMLALYCARRSTLSTAALSGLVTGVAVLIRPNLLPLATLVWVACVISVRSPRWARAGIAAAGTVLGLIALGVIQHVRYGSPFASGYGSVESLFAFQNIWPNLARYPRWMLETHTPVIALFLIAPLWIAKARDRSFVLLLWGFGVAVVASYLPYVYFQMFEWSYTRFLLPALPIMWFLTAAPIDLLGLRIGPAARSAIFVPLVLLVGGYCMYVAKTRSSFELRDGEQKYVHAAEYVRDSLPPNAILMCMQHSGSLWFYTRRPILRWDYVEPRELSDILKWVGGHGYQPFLVVDDEEFERINARFSDRAEQILQRVRPLARFGDAVIYAFD